MTLAFTGHRPESLPFRFQSDEYHRFETGLWREICARVEDGYDTFFCGAARGMDIVCGEIIHALKMTDYPDLKLICAIPFKEQAQGWSEMWKLRYYGLLRDADRIVQLCDSYQKGCYHIRNRYMVDNSDTLLAVWNGENKGGTAYTVGYAWQKGKEIVVLNPSTMKRTVIPPKHGVAE